MGGGGGGLERPQKEKRGSFATKRKKKKRVGFVLDMTPLVDIAFLLLTFFMLSTTLATPQTMEMSIPPETENVDVKQSELLIIYVRDDSKIFQSLGGETPTLVKSLKDLRNLSITENLRVKNRLITSLKFGKKVPYGFVISVLDELNLAEADIIQKLSAENIKRERKFALTPMTEQEVEDLKAL
jgi:biopolymer transport protein ExbD